MAGTLVFSCALDGSRGSVLVGRFSDLFSSPTQEKFPGPDASPVPDSSQALIFPSQACLTCELFQDNSGGPA